MTKTVGLQSFERVGGCCEPMTEFSNDPSLLSRIPEAFGCRRIPKIAALVQRTCWSL